jgi:DNA polymerase
MSGRTTKKPLRTHQDVFTNTISPASLRRANKPATTSAADFLPKHETVPALQAAAQHCEGCPLFKDATQTVFGEGPSAARVMLIGQTPGDQEDLQGRPFVGPAGRLLDEALETAGLRPDEVYVTNVVKHFKWEPQGKRRLHKKPSSREMAACRPWLEAEIRVVAPQVIVCLGATAAQALLGRTFRVTNQRGALLKSSWSNAILATHHPSAALRAPTSADRLKLRKELVVDLKTAARVLQAKSSPSE